MKIWIAQWPFTKYDDHGQNSRGQHGQCRGSQTKKEDRATIRDAFVLSKPRPAEQRGDHARLQERVAGDLLHEVVENPGAVGELVHEGNDIIVKIGHSSHKRQVTCQYVS